MSDALSLDEARHQVYSVEPSDFVAERGRLAQLLRSQGQAAVAAEVQKLRRPSVAAWSINQSARADPHRVAQLFAAGEALEQAHDEATAGRAGTSVRDAGRRRRVLVDELTGDAMRFAAVLSPNPEVHRDAIEATWEAASIDPDVQPLVASAWLAKELPRPSGFGLGTTAPSTSTRDPVPSRERPAASRDELAVRRARAALEQAREQLDEADDAVARADGELGVAQQTAADAERRVADLEAAINLARAEAREAVRDAKTAEQAATKARASRDRAARTVATSIRTLEDRQRS